MVSQHVCSFRRIISSNVTSWDTPRHVNDGLTSSITTRRHDITGVTSLQRHLEITAIDLPQTILSTLFLKKCSWNIFLFSKFTSWSNMSSFSDLTLRTVPSNRHWWNRLTQAEFFELIFLSLFCRKQLAFAFGHFYLSIHFWLEYFRETAPE